MRAKIRDTELYFDVDGVGLAPDGASMNEKPTAFAIHGGPGSDHSGLKGAYGSLTSAMQVVYFDHRGQGRSARGDPAKYTLDENVEDMEALRLHLGLGPTVSIGTSYGGMVAMAHAARYPDSVAKLVLISTASHKGFMPRALKNLKERGTPEQQEVCVQAWEKGITDEKELLRYYTVMAPLYSRRYDPVAGAAALGRAILTAEPMNRAFMPGGFLRTMDLRPELPHITAPTLILAGQDDWICPPEFSKEIRERIPNSRLSIFEDCGHYVRADATQRMIGEILNFVEEGKKGLTTSWKRWI